MLALSTTGWWLIGSGIGGAVVVVAALLLLAIILLARKIAAQAREIEAALDRVRENTNPLFDIANTNYALERIARGLRRLHAEAPPREEPGLLDKIRDRVQGESA